MRPGRPSATSLVVAAGVLRRFADPRTRGLVDPLAAGLARAALEEVGGTWRSVARRLGTFSGGRFADLLEAMLIPGITLHYVLRKRAIESAAREAVGRGLRDVVILGAGLDALGLRLAAEGLDVVEVDHPATQALKRRAIARAGLQGRCRFIAADLAREWPEIPRDRPSLMIAEGVLMYLSAERVRHMLMRAGEEVPDGSVLIATFMHGRAGVAPAFAGWNPLVPLWMRMRGEPFRWCAEPLCVASVLREAGWSPLEVLAAGELRERYQANSPLARLSPADGEAIVVAQRRRAGLSRAETPGRSPAAGP